jgi:hypothetical protein
MDAAVRLALRELTRPPTQVNEWGVVPAVGGLVDVGRRIIDHVSGSGAGKAVAADLKNPHGKVTSGGYNVERHVSGADTLSDSLPATGSDSPPATGGVPAKNTGGASR